MTHLPIIPTAPKRSASYLDVGEDEALASKSSFTAKQHMVAPAEPLADGNTKPRYAIDSAAWVWHPELRADTPAVLRFTQSFELEAVVTARVHISADQRYELFVDGRLLSAGPHRGDLDHWSFASFDLTLEPGAHSVEALVWWLGEFRPKAQITARGGFIMAVENLEQLNTGAGGWEVQRLEGWSLNTADLPAYGDVAAVQSINGLKWFAEPESPRCPAIVVEPIQYNPNGIIQGLWHLHPTSLPEMLRRPVRPGRIRAVSEGPSNVTPVTQADTTHATIPDWEAMIHGGEPTTVPPHQELHVLWDLEDYYCGFSEMTLSGGAGGAVTFAWAEAMYEPEADGSCSKLKGHRDEVLGKLWHGTGDEFLPDGGEQRVYQPLWWRSGRYVRMTIHTARQPLTIQSVRIIETRYPFDNAENWSSADASLDRYAPIARRGLQMCAHETYMDCPYYEQLMYVGDSRLEMLTAYTLWEDDRLTRRGIELFDWSRWRTGFIAERYPSDPFQLSLTFSMLWVAMVHDHAHWRDEPSWIRQRMTGVRCLLENFFSLPTNDGLLESLPGWSFVDWVPQWTDRGIPPEGREGVSSVINLLFVQCLQHAAELEDHFGEALLQQRYHDAAQHIGRQVVEQFWDDAGGRLADNLGHTRFSEHAQALALLTGVLPENRAERTLYSLNSDADLCRATIYFSFYVLEALYRRGQGEAMLGRLRWWQRLPKQGFYTPAERPEPSRSDCHAWGSHPLWHYHASLAGVRPAAPGFKRVRVAPQPGGLSQLNSRLPHPRGEVRTSLKFDDEGRCTGYIDLPDGVGGELIWRDARQVLNGTSNTVDLF